MSTSSTRFSRRGLLRGLPALGATIGAAGVIGRAENTFAAYHAATMDAKTQSSMSPDDALARLKEGNQRFVGAKSKPRDLLAQVKATSTGQYPHSVVLGCIDSRVPPELVFDQGIGDIFAPRIAGNFVNTDILGSIEFATKIAGSKLIVVLGHTSCGAVMGACDDARLGNLTHTLSNIMPAIRSVPGHDGERNAKNADFVQAVAEKNVKLTVEAMTARSDVLADLVEAGKLKVVGAMHDVATGKVAFMD